MTPSFPKKNWKSPSSLRLPRTSVSCLVRSESSGSLSDGAGAEAMAAGAAMGRTSWTQRWSDLVPWGLSPPGDPVTELQKIDMTWNELVQLLAIIPITASCSMTLAVVGMTHWKLDDYFYAIITNDLYADRSCGLICMVQWTCIVIGVPTGVYNYFDRQPKVAYLIKMTAETSHWC